MVPMTFIWWIYHFWARFWPYFNFVDFRAYFGPFSLVNRVQFSNADAGAWNSFLRLGIIFYGNLMHKDTKFFYLRFDISTFGFKAPPNNGHCIALGYILKRTNSRLRIFMALAGSRGLRQFANKAGSSSTIYPLYGWYQTMKFNLTMVTDRELSICKKKVGSWQHGVTKSMLQAKIFANEWTGN